MKKNLIATKATGNLSEKDVEKIHCFIHDILEKDQKVRWYFELNEKEKAMEWICKGEIEDR